jgi:type II secretion system protein G
MSIRCAWEHKEGSAMRRKGFTLIELLIVVAIIAILAAIAVPNFLEAQIRSKVSRANADMRTVALALESYCVDSNTYPPNSPDGLGIVPVLLTTPVSYLSTKEMKDPFVSHLAGDEQIRTRYYTYHKIVTGEEWLALDAAGFPPPAEAIDHPAQNPGAFEKYGKWRLVSKGPDKVYADTGHFPRVLYGSDMPYDPTNGTVSFGNIFRLQNGKPFPCE